MLASLLMMAAAAAACPVERAEYRLRDQPATSLRFIARDTAPDWPSGLRATSTWPASTLWGGVRWRCVLPHAASNSDGRRTRISSSKKFRKVITPSRFS